LYASSTAPARSTVPKPSGSTVRIRSDSREAARQPTDMPRKHAIRTRFVKKVRKMTVPPNQRMQASSKNRITKLTRNRSM
jgi:hypothetical protein